MRALLLLLCLLRGLHTAPASTYPLFLQPLLVFNNGSAVASPAAWAERRGEVAALLEGAILGARPPAPPPLTRATVLNYTRAVGVGAGGSTSVFVELEFATPSGGVAFPIEVIIPSGATTLPLPVFFTQFTHRGWATLGVSRGYLGVVYSACDWRDAAPAFQAAYGVTNASMRLIHARAFVASRALDYILGPLFGAGFPAPGAPLLNASAVAISGHSRNGKQAVIAAAFDERFTAVVGSSPGAPVSTPWQFSSHNFYGEVPSASLAAGWWLPSTQRYDAHPEELPMDGHGLLALVAPRPLAISTAWTDREGDSTLGTEAGARAARQVYELLRAGSGNGSSSALSLPHVLHRPGDHHGFIDADMYFDFLDAAFGRIVPGFGLGWAGQAAGPGAAPPFAASAALTAGGGFSWAQWNASFGGSVPPAPPAAAPLAARVAWLLQLQQPYSGGPLGAASFYAEQGSGSFRYPTVMVSADFESGAPDIARLPVSFGDYVTANVYMPAGARAAAAAAAAGAAAPPLPAVLWLHPYAYSTGYVAAYGQAQVVPALVRAGAVVVAFDQVGFASRLAQGGGAFFARHGGRASPLGHMLRDVRAAVDFLLCSAPASGCWAGGDPGGPGALPAIDPARILLAGYALGGNVALHAGALDARVAGAAAFAAFTPYRTDAAGRATGGLRRLFELHALAPRLGLFEGAEGSVPYDYDELLAALAPRPLLLVSPQEDRDATLADVVACARVARRAWEALGKAELFNHTVTAGGTGMGDAEVALLAAWLQGAGR